MKTQPKNKIAFFDLDGTLYRTNTIDEQNIMAAIASISEYLNISKDSARELLIERRTIPNSANRNAISKVLNMIGIPFDIIERNQDIFISPESSLSEDAELVLLIKKLRESHKIALLTNTRKLIAERIINSLGFTINDFDLFQSGDKLSEAKPSEIEIRNCVKLLDGAIEKSIMIGDRWNVDLEPAHNLGMRTALITSRTDLIQCIKNEIKGHNRVDGSAP